MLENNKLTVDNMLMCIVQLNWLICAVEFDLRFKRKYFVVQLNWWLVKKNNLAL